MKIEIRNIDPKTMQYKPKQRPRYCLSCKKLMHIDSFMCESCWVKVYEIGRRYE